MIALLFLLLGAHARPPQELLDDDARWRAGVVRARSGPAGCWLFEGAGDVTLQVAVPPREGSPPTETALRNKVRFVGKLEGGTWTRIDVWPVGDDGAELPVGLTVVLPTVGRLKPADTDLGSLEGLIDTMNEEFKRTGSIEAVQARMSEMYVRLIAGQLQNLMDETEGETEIAFAGWDDQERAVAYERQLEVTVRKDATLNFKARFPEGGPLPDRLSILWPRKFTLGSWPAILYLRGVQSHLASAMVDGELLPTGESLSLRFRALSYNMGFEQVLRYTAAARCPVTPAIPEPSPVEGAEVGAGASVRPSPDEPSPEAAEGAVGE